MITIGGFPYVGWITIGGQPAGAGAMPGAHASTHDAGGGDPMAIDAAAGTGSLRTLGTNSTSACAGDDPRLAASQTLVLDVRKGSPGTITKGEPVYLSGYNPSGYSEVEVADADDPTKMPAIGIAHTSITNSSTISLIVSGNQTDMNTSLWSVGDGIWVQTDSTIDNTRPTGATALVQRLGTVIRSNISNGTIQVVGALRSNDIPNTQPTDVFRIVDNTDTTKRIDVDASGITTATTRTVTMPDRNLTLGAITDLKIASEAQGDVLYRGASNWTRLAAGTSGQRLKTNGAAANPTWVDEIKTMVFFISGELTTGTKPIRIRARAPGKIFRVDLQADTAPTGSAAIVDVNNGGTTIFTTQANRPQIAAGANHGNTTTINVTTIAANDEFTVAVDQKGSSTAGSDLIVEVHYKADQ